MLIFISICNTEDHNSRRKTMCQYVEIARCNYYQSYCDAIKIENQSTQFSNIDTAIRRLIYIYVLFSSELANV